LEFLHLKNEPQRAQSFPQRAQSFKITQVAAFAPAGLTNPAGVRICQSEPSRERLFFQQVATWVKIYLCVTLRKPL